MAVRWTSALEIGDTQIDIQHRELFEAVNRSLEAAEEGHSAQKVEELLSFLERYVVEHFSAEERLMVQSGYPGYRPHKFAHELFLTDYRQLREQFAATGATPELSSSLQAKVGDWLVTHITRVDGALGKHLEAHGARPGESESERSRRTSSGTPY